VGKANRQDAKSEKTALPFRKANRRDAEAQREIERGQNRSIRKFFRLFGGATFDDRSRIPLQGGARASGPGVDLGTSPPRRGAPPLQGGDSQGNAFFSDVLCLHLGGLSVLAVRSFWLSGFV